MPDLNLLVAWVAILAGLVSGTGFGLFFRDPNWLGGYASWRRRMMRLGHVALIGTGLLNLAFALSVDHLKLAYPPRIASAAFLIGAVSMPAVCFLTAWRDAFHRLFFIPVSSLIVAVADFLWQGLLR